MKKRILSIMLAFAMCLTFGVPAFATEQVDLYNTSVLSDNANIRVAQTKDDEYTYTATFDKETSTIQLQQVSNSTGEVNTGRIVPVAEIPQDYFIQTRAALEENTFTNYEYTKTYGTPNLWELRAPGDNVFSWIYFKTYEVEDVNSEYLVDFKAAVDTVNRTEGVIVGSLGLYALSVLAAGAAGAGALFTGGTLSPAAWAALLAAGGFAKENLEACMDYDEACKNAYDSFWETFNHSEVFY